MVVVAAGYALNVAFACTIKYRTAYRFLFLWLTGRRGVDIFDKFTMLSFEKAPPIFTQQEHNSGIS
jgi:hypothetical protein